MNYSDAKEHYLTRAGKCSRLPDLSRSTQDGNVWRLRDRNGKPIAIVGKDGDVFGIGCPLTITNYQR